MFQNPYATPIKDIVVQLGSDIDKGLDKEKVAQHLERYGPNQIPQDGPKSRWRILFDQLFDPIIYILAVAGLLAFFF